MSSKDKSRPVKVILSASVAIITASGVSANTISDEIVEKQNIDKVVKSDSFSSKMQLLGNKALSGKINLGSDSVKESDNIDVFAQFRNIAWGNT